MIGVVDYLEKAKETDFTEFKSHVWEMSDVDYYAFYDDTFNKLGFFDYTATNTQFFGKWVIGDVLDVGCSGGGLLQALKAYHSGRLVGVDISEVALQEARSKGLEVYWGDAEKVLPFLDKSFHTVIIGHTLEHLRRPEAAFSEAKRICKEHLIILIPLQGEDQRWKKTNMHIQFWPTIESFEEFAGMKVTESMIERNGTLGILLFKMQF